jgi:hypothetical protein
MKPIVICAAAAAWAGGLLGVLSVQYLPDRFFGEHSVCGPWGCGAPPPALLACHGFWLVLFAPATIYATRRLSPQIVWRLGAGLVGLAGVALVAVGVWQGLTWWPAVDPSLHRYVGQRYLFVLATLTDVPVLETLLAGATLWCAGAWRRPVAVPSASASEPENSPPRHNTEDASPS